MNKTLLLLTAVTLSTVGLAYQATAEEQKEAVQHYAGQNFETPEAAIKALENKSNEISEILKAETLTGNNLESIHEISYTLEDAVDALRAQNGAPATAIDPLDEAIQALHFASENHEEAKVREWFAKIEPAAGNLHAAPAAQEQAEKKDIYKIIIKDHKFSPERLTIPAGQKIKLSVDNQDATPEEFESHDLNREKIIAGNTQATIFVGPLKPGEYHFFGEFNMDSANGYIIAE